MAGYPDHRKRWETTGNREKELVGNGRNFRQRGGPETSGAARGSSPKIHRICEVGFKIAMHLDGLDKSLELLMVAGARLH